MFELSKLSKTDELTIIDQRGLKELIDVASHVYLYSLDLDQGIVERLQVIISECKRNLIIKDADLTGTGKIGKIGNCLSGEFNPLGGEYNMGFTSLYYEMKGHLFTDKKGHLFTDKEGIRSIYIDKIVSKESGKEVASVDVDTERDELEMVLIEAGKAYFRDNTKPLDAIANGFAWRWRESSDDMKQAHRKALIRMSVYGDDTSQPGTMLIEIRDGGRGEWTHFHIDNFGVDGEQFMNTEPEMQIKIVQACIDSLPETDFKRYHLRKIRVWIETFTL